MRGGHLWGVEVVPNPNPRLVFPVHQEFVTRNGIYNHENCATELLVEHDVREFLLMFFPLELNGATGSPGAPIAVVWSRARALRRRRRHRCTRRAARIRSGRRE